jgi:Cu-Zn family superoxide dismutase
LVSLSLFAAVSGQIYALAIVKGSANDAGVSGTITFTQPVAGGNVTMYVNVTGITVNPNSLHGIHVHQFGDLTDPAAALNVGGHWVGPNGNTHGCPEVNGTMRHWGDTGNWQATGGNIVGSKTLDLLTLTGVNSIVGRGVIVHAATDDCAIIASSGARLAQGVIGIVNSTVYGGSGEALQEATGITGAVCVLQPSSGSSVSGVVYLTQTGGAGAVTVYAEVTGITGEKGFHLHWWGDISSPTGVATGGHYNPLGSLHGVPPYTQRHKGDMGIISYYQNQTAFYKYTNDYLTLNGQYNVIGRAIHVHANSDDCSNPVGNGGARLAQCVIGLWNNQTLPAFPAEVPVSQNGTAICSVLYPSGPTTGAAGTTGAAANSTTENPSSMGSLAASVVVSFATLFALLVLAL